MDETVNPDPFGLERFVEAQEPAYARALAEIRAGDKRSHWMWFVFPQIAGLGSSSMAQRYAIGGLAEAQAYLGHPLLGPRLRECCEALLALSNRSAHDVFGSPDDWKLRSSMTLFARAAPPPSIFERVLDAYFAGQPDARTLEILGG
jgi:uncharacterized protein (DUF1810 family)